MPYLNSAPFLLHFMHYVYISPNTFIQSFKYSQVKYRLKMTKLALIGQKKQNINNSS